MTELAGEDRPEVEGEGVVMQLLLLLEVQATHAAVELRLLGRPGRPTTEAGPQPFQHVGSHPSFASTSRGPVGMPMPFYLQQDGTHLYKF